MRLFIKSHSELLMSKSEIPHRLLKQQKSDFFLEQHKYRSVPSDREIAYETLDYLFRINYIATSDDLTRVLSLPFFKENVRDSTVFIERLNVERAGVGLDFKKLREKDYEAALKEQIKQEVIRENAKEIEEAVQRRKEESDVYPSVLDETEFNEPEIELERVEENEEAWVPWWKKLKLKADPFPSQEGLAKIADELYDKIVLRTSIFQKYVYFIREEPSELYKETIFFGEFGSGKTTLFDYLRKFLINEKVYPLYIQLYAEQDFQSFLIRFRKKLWEQLVRLYEILSVGHQLESESQDLQQDIIDALERIRSEFHARGFVIFIDDLHKEQRYFKVAMDFLNYLQIFKSELTRALAQVDIAFYISGSADWDRIISNDPKYSGSFSRRETMPPITVDVAFEMLNRRLDTFSSNPDNYKTGGGVTLDYVKKIYRGLENNNLPITFRSFIRSVLTEFEKGNFTILQADPIHIPSAKLLEIKSKLESTYELRKRLNNLIFGGGIQKEEVRAKCLEVLVELYLRKGIREGSDYFVQNAYYFQRLMRARLIDKQRRVGGGWTWVVCKPLYDANKAILAEFNLSMEDYLIRVYYAPKIQSKKQVLARQDEAELNEYLTKVAGDIKAFMQDAQKDHRKIIDIQERFDTNVPPQEIIDLCVASLSAVTNSILAFQRVPYRTKDLSGLYEFWSRFWILPSELSEFIKLAEEEGAQRETIWYVCNTYRDAFSRLFSLLREETDKSRYLTIPLVDLTNAEIKEFHNIRDLWLRQGFSEIVERVVKGNEDKLRTFLFNLYRLQYGDDLESRMKHVDDSTRSYIYSNLNKQMEKNMPVGQNEFEQVNRGNYKNFMVGMNVGGVGKYNWDHTFSKIFAPWSEIDLNNFLSMQAEFNLDSSHQKEGSLTAEQQSRIYTYVLQSLDFLRRINHAYIELLDCCVASVEEATARRVHYVSFDGGKDKAQLAPIFVDPKEVGRVFTLLSSKSGLFIDLSDSGFVESYYNLKYPQFIAFLARAIHQSPQDLAKTLESISLPRNQGCEIELLVKHLAGAHDKEKGPR